MITTVTLNPAIDITYNISNFKSDQIHRVESMYKEPGGKGINVAKVIKTLEAPVTATGFIGGNNGKTIVQLLAPYTIPLDFEPIAGESRLCLNIMDDRGQQTEILEKGPVVFEAELCKFQQRLERLAAKSRFVVFSGSLPVGLSPDTYAELIERVQYVGAKAIVDTSGEALRQALLAKPFMVKPNLEELGELCHKKEITNQDCWDCMSQWHQSGITCSVVSSGEKGFFAKLGDQQWRVIPPKINAVNSVGCGDTMVGALAAALYNDKPMETCLVYATAAAVANALENQAGRISLETMHRYQSKVQVRSIT